MSTCMHRLLLSRVLCNASGSAGGGGTSPQVWEDTLKILCLTTRNSVQSYSSKANISPGRETIQPLQEPDNCPESSVLVSSGIANYKEAHMDRAVKEMSGEVKSKRTREFLSPLRPAGSKKKVKGGKASLSTPPLICLEDIPVPSKVKSAAKKKMPTLDFIPLPPSPPPPLPPPLPSPPPPPSHSEMDEVLNDFFVLDTTGSGTLFPLPLPPDHVANHKRASKRDCITKASTAATLPLPPDHVANHKRASKRDCIAKASTAAQVADGVESDPEEISVVYNSDSVLPDQFKNINLVDRSKNSAPSVRRKSDKIDIIFEGQWPWVIRSPDVSQRGRRKQLLSKKPSSSDQVRNCHQSTKHGFKTIEKSPEKELVSSFDTSGPDIITLDTSAHSLLGGVTPEEFIRFDTNENTMFGDEEKEIITLEHPTRKDRRPKKSQKRVSKESKNQQRVKESESTREAQLFMGLCREASPDVQKVGVIDPDVVEIDDGFASSSNCIDMDVVDVYDSENERLSVGSSAHAVDMDIENGNAQDLDMIGVHESDKESVDSNSDHGAQGVDISTDDFVALGKARLEDLENTEIDLDDEVLGQRERLENLRQWYTTRLGEDVLLRNRVNKKDTIFTLLSYNVLAQQLLLDNQFLYNECNKRHLDWGYRWALLQHEIEDLSPDVLLLQEVQASHYFSHFLPWLTLKGYDGLYKKRTGDKCDGCAIFFKTKKFSLVEHCTVEYLQPKATKVLDRDNIGIIAKLAPIGKPESSVCVATTHFLYNPRRHDVKLAQAILLLSELDRLCYEGEENGVIQYCPVIVTGDFNSEPHAALLDMLKEGRLHYQGLSSRTLTPHGMYPVLGAELIPPSLGITDRCQHAVLAQSRFVEKRTGKLFSLADKRKIEESLIRLNNSDRTKLKGIEAGCTGPPPTGWYSHNFNFNSVYRHYSKKAIEATTFHNKWTSVDYILYSRIYNQSNGQLIDGSLKLLARYGLLTGTQARTFAPLPSAVCPSDHFPLAAQFLLRDK